MRVYGSLTKIMHRLDAEEWRTELAAPVATGETYYGAVEKLPIQGEPFTIEGGAANLSLTTSLVRHVVRINARKWVVKTKNSYYRLELEQCPD